MREMGKAEDEVIGQLRRGQNARAQLRERDDEPRRRPRLETLEVELAAAKEESATWRS